MRLFADDFQRRMMSSKLGRVNERRQILRSHALRCCVYSFGGALSQRLMNGGVVQCDGYICNPRRALNTIEFRVLQSR